MEMERQQNKGYMIKKNVIEHCGHRYPTMFEDPLV